MGVSELKKFIEEYNVRAKTWNVTTLAVSALIKKIVIANFPLHDSVHADILNYTKSELEERFQQLFVDLMEAKRKAVEEGDLRARIEIELFTARQEIEKSEEIDESHLVLYESGVEAANQLDTLANWDVQFLVNYMRSHCLATFSKMSDLTEFLEKNFEKKLELSILV